MTIETGAQATAADVNAVREIALGNYTGADGNDRQITTGFQCALVIVWTDAGADWTWICFRTAVCTKLANTPSIVKATDVLLHASDGFVVDQENANHNGETYYYFAIKL